MPPQTSTICTDVTIIVVRPALQQQAENAAIAAEPEGGAGTFVPGQSLRTVGTTGPVTAYWARWNMKSGQRSAFASAMGGPMNVLSAGQSPNLSRDRWMFDATEGAWDPEQVLAALGMERNVSTEP